MNKFLAMILGFLWGVFSIILLSLNVMGDGSGSWLVFLTLALPGGLASITATGLEWVGLRVGLAIIFPLVIFYGCLIMYIALFFLKRVFHYSRN